MEQIDNQKFGAFLIALRKEKGLTQKQLADKLFVSDKAVSKWERGASIPNIGLLLPLAQLLDVTVSELLRGEREPLQPPTPKEISLPVLAVLRRRKRGWMAAFCLCLAAASAEILLLHRLGIRWDALGQVVLPASALFLLFGGWFCFFARDLLPGYYDTNKISFVSQGFLRLNLPGLSFHNGNWRPVCTAIKAACLSTAVLYPLFCLIAVCLWGIDRWTPLEKPLLVLFSAALLLAVYKTGKKYG